MEDEIRELQHYSQKNNQRISELETSEKINMNTIQINMQKIAELREDAQTEINTARTDIHEAMEGLQNQLNELKGDISSEANLRKTNVKTLNRFLNDWANKIKNNKEVLREFLLEKPLTQHTRNKLLEKLDSGGEKVRSAAHTEEDSCWNCGKHGIICMNSARDTSEPCEMWSPRPKPPEPKCKFCGRDLIFYKDRWICGHGCTKPAVKAEDRPPGGTGNEPRENDTIDLPYTSREKILISKFVEDLSKDWRGMTWEEMLDYIDELKEKWEGKL